MDMSSERILDWIDKNMGWVLIVVTILSLAGVIGLMVFLAKAMEKFLG
jgi:predicted negative regulator of RcsB-dependent stress response